MLTIPYRFNELLSRATPKLTAQFNTIVDRYSQILDRNEATFFADYTDHGIQHINKILISADNLIPDDCFSLFKPNDIVVFIFSAILHDIGMQLSVQGFENIITGIWDNNIIEEFDKKKWSEEWNDFLKTSQRLSDRQQIDIWGKCGINVQNPDFKNINEIDRKLIGEFLRRHHPRLAHEIAINGFPTSNGSLLSEGLDTSLLELGGLIARSHGISIRDTYPYLEKNYGMSYKRPFNIQVIYWMAILRIADYMQIQKDRAPSILFKIKSFSSPFSAGEWKIHDCIDFINTETDDPEMLYVHAKPENPDQFVKLTNLLKDIQSELDVSWAVIGETYGLHLKMKYRRITSNIHDVREFSKKVNFIPYLLAFRTDASLLKLLIAPLYNNESSMAVRELLQNAIDACVERRFLVKETDHYKESIIIKVDLKDKDMIFSIQDNGIGMTIETLKNYYFNSGKSYRNSVEWFSLFTNDNKSEISRTGKFGVGALSTFLLGNEVEIETRAIGEKYGLSFEMKAFEDTVQINKCFGIQIGTKISVRLKKEIKDTVINSRSESMENRLPWFCSYLKKNNFISYNINKILEKGLSFPNEDDLIPENLKDDYNWSFFIADNHLKVYLTYRFSQKTLNEKKEHGEIICNGFRIKNGYQISEKKFTWDPPSLYIEDNNASLPLSLDRNSIFNNTVPFEKELIERIAKDLIETLEDIDFETIGDMKYPRPKLLKYKTSISLDEHIICFREYYTINLPFILNSINCNTVYTIVPKSKQDFFYKNIFNKEVAYRIKFDNSELNTWFSIQSSPKDLKKAPTSQILFVDSNFRSKSRMRGEGSRYNFDVGEKMRDVLEDLYEPRLIEDSNDPNVNITFINRDGYFNKVSKNTFLQERELDIKWLVDIFQTFYDNDYRIPYNKSERKIKYKKL